MVQRANKPRRDSAQVPTIKFNERQAHDACKVHFALLKAERDDPELRDNPQWTVIRQDAYERFCAAFAVLV